MVVVFIGILAGGALYVIDPLSMMQRLRDNKRKSDLLLVVKALNRYYQDFRHYPPNPRNCPSSDYRMIKLDGSPVDWGDKFLPYIDRLPKDPSKGHKYVYFVSCNRQAYWLYASLEKGEEDSKSCNKGKACNSLSTNGIPLNACGRICNYAESSPNVSL